jgi:putative Holliday junction resolvase
MKGKRIVGIDFGLKRIGVAISDERKIIASPFPTIIAEKKGIHTAKKLVAALEVDMKARNYELEKIVIGLPLMMSGKTGFLADEVNHFIELLKTLVNCPIIPWDERLTTMQAEKSLKEFDMSRKKRSKVVDSVASIIILQNYLDHLAHIASS